MAQTQNSTTQNIPLIERMKNYCAFSSRDFSEDLMTQVFYGLVFGWGVEDDSEMAENIFKQFGWSKEDVDAVMKLHECYLSLTNHN